MSASMNAGSLESVVNLLVTALRQPDSRRQSIEAFQRTVWKSTTSTTDPRVSAILADLAYDLDFYEPNAEARREDPSFFGDDRAEAEIRSALRKIKDAGFDVPEG